MLRRDPAKGLRIYWRTIVSALCLVVSGCSKCAQVSDDAWASKSDHDKLKIYRDYALASERAELYLPPSASGVHFAVNWCNTFSGDGHEYLRFTAPRAEIDRFLYLRFDFSMGRKKLEGSNSPSSQATILLNNIPVSAAKWWTPEKFKMPIYFNGAGNCAVVDYADLTVLYCIRAY